MNNGKLSITKLSMIAGVLICLAMMAYFFIMKISGLVAIPELRLLNIVIMLIGTWLTIRHYNQRSKSHIQYFEGLSLGFATVQVAITVFAVFIGIYLYKIDPDLLVQIKAHAPMMGKYLTPVSAVVSLLVEGMVSGLVISFIVMQYFKDDTLHSPFAKHEDNLTPEEE